MNGTEYRYYMEANGTFCCGHGDDLDVCSMPFKRKKALYRHWRSTHLDVNYPCEHCHETFSRPESLACHIDEGRCKVLESTVWDYEQAVEMLKEKAKKPAQSKDVRRRSYIPQIVELPDDLVQLKSDWLYFEKAPIGHVLRGERLGETTLYSYGMHVDKWIQFAFLSSGKPETLDLATFLILMVKTSTTREFFNLHFVLERDPNLPISESTIRNYCWAMMRFITFVKTKVEEKVLKISMAKLDKAFQWCKSTAAHHGVQARANHLIRNDINVLKENNMWLEGHQLVEVYDKLETLWNAKIKEMIADSDEGDDRPFVDAEVAISLQFYAILSILLKEIPLRSQNIAQLQVGKTILFEGTADKPQVVIKYEQFKSKSENIPYVRICCSEEVARILTLFYKYVRPNMYERNITHKYLFCNFKTGGRISHLGEKMAAFIKEKTGVDGIGPSRLRVMAATAAQDLPDDQRRALAKGMLHSMETHQRYYAKSDHTRAHDKARQVQQGIFKSWATGDNSRQAKEKEPKSQDFSDDSVSSSSSSNKPEEFVSDDASSCDSWEPELITQALPTSPTSSPDVYAVPSRISKVSLKKRKREDEEIVIDGQRISVGDIVYLPRAKRNAKLPDEVDPPVFLAEVLAVHSDVDVRIKLLDYDKKKHWLLYTKNKPQSVHASDILGKAPGEPTEEGWWWGENPFPF